MASTIQWYFDFDWDVAPASLWIWPAAGVVIYLLIVAVLIKVMDSRPALSLNKFTALHNLMLSAGSLVMLVGTALELHRRYVQTSTFDWFFCENTATLSRGPLYFWSYVYYLSKYWEMLDTVLVLLQKSKVPNFGLQVYHHAAVVPMAWLWCHSQQTLQWGGLLFNTLVHVVMYHYYAWRVLGLPTPWKKWITKLQIVQFVTSFVLLIMTLRMWLKRRAEGSTCAGMNALLYNCIFNATLLLQFVGVDRKNARAAKSK